MKRNNNKKNLVYCTLAICLIAGVWKLTSLTTSTDSSYSEAPVYDGPQYMTLDGSIPKSDNAPEENTNNTDGKRSGLDIVNDIESKKDEKQNTELSDFRDSFDVTNPEDVKTAQRILQKLGYSDIKEDGIFGPKTDAAWKLAIANLDNKDTSTNIANTTSPKTEVEEKIVTTTINTDNLTTLNSTKTTVSSNNSILD